jgi:alpha-beta hydrolase superfamily lysophospholipase
MPRIGPMSFSLSRHTFRGMIWVLSAIFCLGVITFLALSWIGSDQFITPTRRPLEPRHLEVLARPADFGFDLEAFPVTTHDGFELAALLATPAKAPGIATKTRRMAHRLHQAVPYRPADSPGTVIFLHGRGGRKEDMLSLAERWVAAGYCCLVYDARAHGKSGGRFCTFGEKEVRDLTSVLNSGNELLQKRGFPTGEICAVGISLGASVILQSLPEETRIVVAVAVAPFSELSPIVFRAARRTLSPHLPDSLIHASLQLGGMRADFDPSRISPLRQIAVTMTPVFFAHGALDEVIPFSHSEALFSAAPEPKSLRIIPTAYHYNILAEGGDDLYQEMIEFCLNPASRDLTASARHAGAAASRPR